MSATIPSIEPVEITIGDTWEWSRSLPDYPATTWTLTYRLINASANIPLTATANGTDFIVTIPAATTALYTAGDYLMVGSVSDGTDRFEIYRADITLTPNPFGDAYDFRTYNEQMVDTIKLTLSGAIARRDLSYMINGRSFTAKSDKDLLEALAWFKSAVANEKSKGKNRKILARFI